MRKVIAIILIMPLLMGVLSSCASSSDSISISGSSALYPLAKEAAAQFKKDNPGVAVFVSAGGSGVGLNNLLSRTVDIGNSDVYAEEKLEASWAERLVDHKVCIIGISIIVNADVGTQVKNLSKDQIKGIFSGEITNWQQLGGPNEPITIVNRPTSSGTRALFTKWALDGQSSLDGDKSLQTDDSNALLTIIGSTKGAIGYIGLSYLVSTNARVSQLQIDGIDATYDNIYNNEYPVWGYEHMYTYGEPQGLTKAFLEYLASPEMAAKTEAMGYGVSSKLNAEAAASR